MRCLWLPIAGLAASIVALSVPLAIAGPADKYDAGLSAPFESPEATSGQSLNVLSYGATPNNSSDNDATAIQSAISAAMPGDSVYIPNGVYHVQSTVNLKTGVSVVGESRDATVLAGAYQSSPQAVIDVAPGVNNLTLSSFRITQASGKLYAAGVRVGNTSGPEVARIAVRDLFIEKHQRFGVLLQNAYHVLVDGNLIQNASALGGGGSGYGIIIDGSRSSNNWVKNNVVGPVIRHGILLQESAHHNLIENNKVTGAVSGAIDLHGEDEYSNEIRYNQVSDCVLNGTTLSPNGAGIEVGEFGGISGVTWMHDNSGPHNWIHHNEVYNCTSGLGITNNSNYTYIEDNIFHDNLEAGIEAVAAPVQHLYIARNTIYGNGSGIALNDVTQAVLEENSVTFNRDYGIWTNAGVTDYSIMGNTVVNNGVDVSLGSPNGTIA